MELRKYEIPTSCCASTPSGGKSYVLAETLAVALKDLPPDVHNIHLVETMNLPDELIDKLVVARYGERTPLWAISVIAIILMVIGALFYSIMLNLGCPL